MILPWLQDIKTAQYKDSALLTRGNIKPIYRIPSTSTQFLSYQFKDIRKSFLQDCSRSGQTFGWDTSLRYLKLTVLGRSYRECSLWLSITAKLVLLLSGNKKFECEVWGRGHFDCRWDCKPGINSWSKIVLSLLRLLQTRIRHQYLVKRKKGNLQFCIMGISRSWQSEDRRLDRLQSLKKGKRENMTCQI